MRVPGEKKEHGDRWTSELNSTVDSTHRPQHYNLLKVSSDMHKSSRNFIWNCYSLSSISFGVLQIPGGNASKVPHQRMTISGIEYLRRDLVIG